MKDIHSVSGGASGGSRRFRLTGSHALSLSNLNSHHHLHQAALKCPRCDSLNTKFCYYNNYNLSQPRHFCKSCRRYWTNGGVLRNVPIGGGCRKTKRSSSVSKAKRSQRSPSPVPSVSAPPPSNSNSSSESSGINATVAIDKAPSTLAGIPMHQVSVSRPTAMGFDQTGGGLFPDLGGLAGLMSSSAEACDGGINFGFPCLSMNQNQPQQATVLWGQQRMMSADVDNNQKECGMGPFDWQGSCGSLGLVDQSIFDLPSINAADHLFWNQTHWGNNTITGGDHQDTQNNLFLP